MKSVESWFLFIAAVAINRDIVGYKHVHDSMNTDRTVTAFKRFSMEKHWMKGESIERTIRPP